MDEHVCEWTIIQEVKGAGRFGSIVKVICGECGANMSGARAEARLNATERLSAELWQAYEIMIGWLVGDDEIDSAIHTGRWIERNVLLLCNCENELPPCPACEAYANILEGK